MLVLAVNIAPMAEFPVLATLCIFPYGYDAFSNLGLVKLVNAFVQSALMSEDMMVYVGTTDETYLNAVDEFLGVMTGLAWMISYLFNPELLKMNPLKARLGYNNICVAWDAPPAQYIISIVAGMFSYLGLRYAYLSLYRTSSTWKTLDPCTRFLSLTGDLGYAFGFLCFLMIFPLTPFISALGHTEIFFTFILCRVWFIVSRFILDRNSATFWGWVYCIIYATMSVVGVVNVYIGFIRYDKALASGEEEPQPMLPLGTPCSCFIDYLWIVMSLFSSRFLPKSNLVIGSMMGKITVPGGTTIGKQRSVVAVQNAEK